MLITFHSNQCNLNNNSKNNDFHVIQFSSCDVVSGCNLPTRFESYASAVLGYPLHKWKGIKEGTCPKDKPILFFLSKWILLILLKQKLNFKLYKLLNKAKICNGWFLLFQINYHWSIIFIIFFAFIICYFPIKFVDNKISKLCISRNQSFLWSWDISLQSLYKMSIICMFAMIQNRHIPSTWHL